MSQAISRRHALATLAGAAVLPLASATQLRVPSSSPFVLVHGAWHGGWCWRKLLPLLREKGHDAFAPTLTGLGDRRHLARPDVSLATHVQDISTFLEMEDLTNVVLVGHSYAGFVISAVAARARQRVRHVAFLDAFVPERGRSLRDDIGARIDEIAKAKGDGWRIPMSELFSLADLGVRDPADVAWMTPRLADQPLRTFTEPSDVAPDTFKSFACSYVLTSAVPAFARAAERARASSWQVRTLQEAGHDSMVTRPRELADLLVGLLDVRNA